MKKFLPTLMILLALGAGGGALYLFQKQRGAAGSAGAVAEILPASTQLLLAVPDLPGTVSAWKTTDLYQIWNEPEVRDFLAKPLSKLPPHEDFNAKLAQVVRLRPTNLFVALTGTEDKANRPLLLAGFEFQGGKEAVETLLAEPRDQFRRKYPAGKADLLNHEGQAIESYDAGNGNALFSTYLESRYLISNHLPTLKATLDRIAHRTPAAGDAGTLEKDADFKTVLAKLPSDHETLIFARPQPWLRKLYDLAAASGQPVKEADRAEAEKLKAVGATTAIQNGKLRDTAYLLAPGMKPGPAKLNLGGLSLTSPDTLLFVAGIYDLPASLDLPAGPLPPGTPVSGVLAGLQELASSLHARGVSLERFRQAFGNEVSLGLDWPAGRTQPSLVASVDVRDRAVADRFVSDLTAAPLSEASWQTAQNLGLTFHTLRTPSVSLFSPTLTLSDRHLIFGLNPPEVRDAAQREQTSPPNFTQEDAYKKAFSMVEAPNANFVYVDTADLFARAYGTLRGVAVFGAALVYPQLGEYVDLGKMPNPDTITKHLSPTVYSQKTDEQGSLLDSVGSVTVGQATIGLAGLAGAAAAPMLQQQLAEKGLPTLPAARPTPVPAPVFTPSPAPQPGQGE